MIDTSPRTRRPSKTPAGLHYMRLVTVVAAPCSTADDQPECPATLAKGWCCEMAAWSR